GATAAGQSVRAADATRAQLALPRPTGQYAVGRDTLHLVDHSRTDPWMPGAGARELMVSIHYPARRGTGGASAPYMTRPEAKALLEGQRLDGRIPVETVTSVRTNARTAARPAPGLGSPQRSDLGSPQRSEGKHPLVVLSPGFTLQRTTLSVLAEELAGHGYVVATVDHAYESYGTSFPGGKLTTCAACDVVEEAPDDEASKEALAKVARGRSADISFLLDRLTGRHPAWRHSRMIDRHRIGAAGHSIGGNAAAQVMADDSRVRAGVNLDGSFFAPVPEGGLEGRPFLLFGKAKGHSPGDEDVSWNRAWGRLDGWKRWLTVEGAGHFTFIDLPVLAGQLGMTDPEAPLPGDRSGDITRACVGAFFEQHLRGIPQPLLHGPSPANPEVHFQRP
ncbi:MAG: alpha/beta hydrolase family protein, partial [Streptomyces sp.]|uniref:alpha/beta hydrolase family protein n=1 Tax=Streptomyces sp. TaxID=1931 RepID=UPI003D6B1366